MTDNFNTVDISGNWELQSAKFIGCENVSDYSFSHPEENCYELREWQVCSRISWEILPDSSVIISSQDYYPDVDTTYSNIVSKIKITESSGDLMICDSLGVKCSPLTMYEISDTLVLEDQNDCFKRLKFLRL